MEISVPFGGVVVIVIWRGKSVSKHGNSSMKVGNGYGNNLRMWK